jgi:tetratricopeptide (TPR) repeat protein
MSTLQKTVITAAFAAIVGTGIYEARQAANARAEVQRLEQQQAPLTEQIQQLQRERDDFASKLAVLRDDNERLTLNLAEEYYQHAMKHGMEHEYEAELDDLNKAIEMDPHCRYALFVRASLSEGYGKAVVDYSRVLKAKPNDCSAAHNRAACYEQLRQFDDAIADYTALIEGNTDFSLVGNKDHQLALEYYYRGRAYQWYKKDYAKAVADYNQALRLDPNTEGVHLHRGQCYEALGQRDKAQEDFAIEEPK